jgi:hypothetical protein
MIAQVLGDLTGDFIAPAAKFSGNGDHGHRLRSFRNKTDNLEDCRRTMLAVELKVNQPGDSRLRMIAKYKSHIYYSI